MGKRRDNMITDGKAGFSLVELSIVLVILGLLTGGILGGQSLIKAAELRSVGKEYEQWQIAVNTFKGKYLAIPGDFKRATDIWGESGVGNGKTWDGNGDGRLSYASGGGAHGEIFTFWQHLMLAGLITGEYTGVSGPGSNEDSLVGENVPASKFSGGGWSLSYVGAGQAYTAQWYDLDYGNMYQIGSKSPGYEMGAALFAPEDAWNIDVKFDDGQPAKGIIIARFWNNQCAAADDGSHSATDLEASYKLSDSSARCALAFRNAF